MSFGYRKSVTIDHTQCGGSNTSNYPIGIRVVDNDLRTVANGGYVQNSNGFDIRPFSDVALTTALTYELASYDATTGTLELYVNIPTVSVSSDVVFYLGFGDPTINTDGSSTSTWDANFKAVYHFGSSGSLGLNDSTSNARTLSNTNASNLVTASSGINSVGGAGNYAVVSNQVPRLESNTAPITVEPGTLEAWANASTDVQTASMLVNIGKTATSDSAFNILGNIIGTTHGGLQAQTISGGLPTNASFNVTVFPITPDSSWHYIVGLFTSGASRTINADNSGSPVTNTTSKSVSGINNLAIGAKNANNVYSSQWRGKIDEVRISNIIRSSDWQTITYNNLKVNSTLLTFGPLVNLGFLSHLGLLGVG